MRVTKTAAPSFENLSFENSSFPTHLVTPMLTLSNLSVSYDGSRILRDVSLEVAPGQVVCLMGRNGVGKTTALKAIAGLVKPDRGVHASA